MGGDQTKTLYVCAALLVATPAVAGAEAKKAAKEDGRSLTSLIVKLLTDYLRPEEVVMIRAVMLAAVVTCGLSSTALAKNFRWICTYPVVANPEGVTKQEFKLEFLVDDFTEKAVVVGNAGMSDVDLHTGSLGVTFMEKLGGGAVQTTTIANGGASVHSRHTVKLEGKVFASQSYGQCKLVQ